MRIVKREEFMKMPANTVFSKVAPWFIDELMIKGDTSCTGVDFYYQSIQDAIKSDSSEDFFHRLEDSQLTGRELEMDFNYEGRDGLFDKDQMFAVWSARDVRSLIDRLQECLK